MPLISKHKAYTQARAATRAKDWPAAVRLWAETFRAALAQTRLQLHVRQLGAGLSSHGNFELRENTVEQV